MTLKYADPFVYSYSDIEIKLCQLVRHPQNWRYSSAFRHDIPVLSTNFIEHFQTSETFISRLTTFLAFAIFFNTISTHNQTPQNTSSQHSAYDSRYDKTKFLTLERSTCLELIPTNLTVRSLLAAENFSGRQEDTTCSSDFCK